MIQNERSMASNRKALFDVIDGLKSGGQSIEEASLIIKACHEITDTFRVEIRGVEVATEITKHGLEYNTVAPLLD